MRRSCIENVVLVMCVLVVLAPVPAAASHFRYAHLTWRARPDVGAAAVEFAVNAAWRRDEFAGSAPDGHPEAGDMLPPPELGLEILFGDGSRSGFLDFQVTTIDAAQNWLAGRAVGNLVHVYPGGGNFVAAIDAAARILACAPPNAHINFPNGNYRIETLVNADGANSSPVSSLPPLVHCEQESLCQFSIPAADDAPAPLAFRLSSPEESGRLRQPGPPDCPNAAAVDPATGVYSWDTHGCRLAVDACGDPSLITLYSTQVTIADRTSRSAIDFLIQLVPPAPHNAAPVFMSPPSPCNARISVTPGHPIDLDVEASDSDGNACLDVAGLPVGAVLTPVAPACGASPKTRLRWTPSPGQVGQYVLTFTVTDAVDVQATCPVTVDVNEEICGDGIDNDDDGLIDCEDQDCLDKAGACESCADCVDNDHNFLTDLADPACGAGELSLDALVVRLGRSPAAVDNRIRTRARLGGLVTDPGTDVRVMVTAGVAAVLDCERIPGTAFHANKRRTRFVFKRRGAFTGVARLVLRPDRKKGTTRVDATLKGVDVPEATSELVFAVGLDGTGVRGVASLRRGRRKLVYP